MKLHINVLLSSASQSHFIVGRTLYVCGTNEWLDWVDNLDCRLSRFGSAIYHRGFLMCALAIMAEVDEGYDLVVGHSRGAAVANIISCIAKVPCIGFATPCFTLQNTFNSLSINYIHRSDIIRGTTLSGFGRNAKVKLLGTPGLNPIKAHLLKSYAKFSY